MRLSLQPVFGFSGTRALPARRLAPSVLLMLVLFVGLLAGGSSLLNDPDTQWHIEVGRRIWAAKSVPATDVFSHTFQGSPWIAKEWLSQLAFYAAHVVAGWRGVVVLAAAAIALAFAGLYAWLGRRLKSTVALAFTLVAITLALSHFLARPHVLVLPLIVLWMASIVAALDRREAPPLALAAVMTLWANMHGSFPLGLVMAGTLAGEGVLFAPTGLHLTRLRQWGLFLCVSLGATLITPQGWRALLVSLKMSGNGETLRYVGEWQPLSLDPTGCIVLALLAALAAVMARDFRANLFRIIAMGFLAYLMVRHARFISLFGVIAPMLATRSMAAMRGVGADEAAAPVAMPWPPIAGALVAALVAIVLSQPVPAADVTPQDAYRAAVAAGVSGPVYNDYDFGGFLMARGVQTFVDGRTDQLFLGPFLPDLAKAITAKDNAPFASLLSRYHVRWALVRAHSGEARHLADMPGWRLIHTDPVAAVYKLD